jgi:hypothetical protein
VTAAPRDRSLTTRSVARRGGLAVLVAVGVVLAILSVGWRCPVLLVAGVPCPTCGMTRAVRLALQGDLAGATRLHPLMWLAVPVVALFVSVELVGYARSGAWGASRRMPLSNLLMVGTAALLFALWVARFAGMFGGPAPLH